MFRQSVIGIALISALNAASAATPFDAASESKLLLARDAEWAAVAAEGKDVERTASYWSDDALIVPDGQPIAEGRAAIRAFVASNFQTPGFHIHWISERPIFSPDGMMAWMRSTATTTAPGPDGHLGSFASRGVTVWRRESDGVWRCIVDIWNNPPPPN